MSLTRLMIRSALPRSCSTHQAKSSNAAGSNSKLLAGFIERNSFLALFGFQQTTFHILAFQKVGCLPLRFDLTPEINRDDNADRVAVFIRDVLYARHKSAL